jgi:hypothetical protein
MAAALVASAAVSRIAGPQPNVSLVPITITGVSTVYVQGVGNGLPFDLTPVLNGIAFPELFSVNPADVIGLIADDATHNQALLGSLIVGGTAGAITYTQQQGMSVQSANTTLLTCPCLVRIFGGTTELAAGAYSGVLTGFLVIQKGGHN